MMWIEMVKVEILNFSANHIHVEVSDEEEVKPLYLTGVYGFLEDCNKWKTW